MTQYREILRLHSQGISQRNIAVSCACSLNFNPHVHMLETMGGMKYPAPVSLLWKQ